MNHKCVSLLSVFLLLGTGTKPQAVLAQGGGAVAAAGAANPEPATPQQPAQQPAGPPRRPFTGSITAGTSLESGRTNLNGVQIDFEAQKPYSNNGSFTMSTIYTWANTKPQGAPRHFKAADRFYATGAFEHQLGKIPILMARSIFLRDEVAQIHHRIEQMGGIGATLRNERVRFRVVPGISALNHDRDIINEGSTDYYWGVFQDLTIRINPTWSFSQYVFFKRDFTEKADYGFDGKAALTGMVTRRLGVQMAYYYAHENLLPPGAIGRYQKISAGLQIKF